MSRRGIKRYKGEHANRQITVTRVLITAFLVMIMATAVAVYVNYKQGNYDHIMTVLNVKSATPLVEGDLEQNVSDDIMYTDACDYAEDDESEVSYESENVEADEPEIVTENETIVASSYRIKDFEWLGQYPELPTGCEITSLTSVLNYYGYDVDKEVMADDYLEKGSGSFYKMFLGNPRSEHGFGCMSQPIADAAKKYFDNNSADMIVENVSGMDLDEVFQYVAKGLPMIVWNTMGMLPSYESYKYDADGETLTWRSQEHCVVVIGYDYDAGVVYVSDPMAGIVTRDMETFRTRYEELNRQAVLVMK